MVCTCVDVHDGCGGPYAGKEQGADRLGKQAPMATVNLYNTTQLDCYKVAGAMYTELDYGIAEVVDALKEKEMFDLLIFVSDNGGPLDHTTNSPLRGGKHTFYEGGVRVMSFISGPAVPPARRGTRWTGMAHSSDWYVTITEGIAGGKVPANTGPRAPDGFNLWPAILADSPGPRTEVVHQVENISAGLVCRFNNWTPPAYIWPGNLTSGVPITDPGVSVQFQKQLAETCAAAAASGFIEPLL